MVTIVLTSSLNPCDLERMQNLPIAAYLTRDKIIQLQENFPLPTMPNRDRLRLAKQLTNSDEINRFAGFCLDRFTKPRVQLARKTN